MTTESGAQVFEEPEGIDPPKSNGWGEYPLDSVFVRTETRGVNEVYKRIKAQRFIMDPEFQRDFVWPEDKQSKLIESCVMRIPLPVFYVAEAKDGRIIVVDGLQRLTTFTRFLDGDLRLKGLGDDTDQNANHPLNGKKFLELPVNLQERIEDTQLTMYILDAKAPERARLDIFDRVNSGVPLSRQQMRNSLYNGDATKWLKSAAQSDVFKKVTGNSLDTKSMRDREAINRFCAFSLRGWKSYLSGDMDEFLAETLETMNGLKESELTALRTKFDSSMNLNLELFGRHAFRKSVGSDNPNAHRTVINIAFFDVCSVLLADHALRLGGNLGKNTEINQRLREAIVSLLHDGEFELAITYSTNSTRQVQSRFSMADEVLKRLMIS